MRDRIHERILRVDPDTQLACLVASGLAYWVLGFLLPAAVVPVGLVFMLVLGDHMHYLHRRRHRVIPTATAREKKP